MADGRWKFFNHEILSAAIAATKVAQTVCLLYRPSSVAILRRVDGLVIRRRHPLRTPGRLPVGDTAGCQPALRESIAPPQSCAKNKFSRDSSTKGASACAEGCGGQGGRQGFWDGRDGWPARCQDMGNTSAERCRTG